MKKYKNIHNEVEDSSNDNRINNVTSETMKLHELGKMIS